MRFLKTESSFMVKMLRNTVLILFVVVFISVIYNMKNRESDTESALIAEATASAEFKGVFIRAEQPMKYSGSGVLVYNVSDGGKLGKGSIIAEAYPDGTVYGCLFHGRMTLDEQADEYTWKIHVDEVELDEGQVPEAIEDGMRFVTCEPYGLKAGNDMLLYLPGTPVEKLPEDFLMWAHLYAYGEDVKELPYYGLYDPQEETGFIGEEPYGSFDEIVGVWRKEGEKASETYTQLTIKSDGTGEMITLPEGTGVPLTWYADGEGWTVCFGSPDTTGKVSYDAETDQLTVTEPMENGENQYTVYFRDWWTESELFFSEGL